MLFSEPLGTECCIAMHEFAPPSSGIYSICRVTVCRVRKMPMSSERSAPALASFGYAKSQSVSPAFLGHMAVAANENHSVEDGADVAIKAALWPSAGGGQEIFVRLCSGGKS